MRIAITGTRGIPNAYGGFEQFAERISVELVKRGHEVVVYSPHYHPHSQDDYKGVHVKHVYSPEKWLGNSFGSFFYDWGCMKDALQKETYDIIYETGYTSILPSYLAFGIKKQKRPVIVTNMDGLEYQRTKYSPIIRRFLLWEERMVAEQSHYLVADNLGIQDYYSEKYGKQSEYIAYGADIPTVFNVRHIHEYGLQKDNYLLLIARLEPENNIAMAIDGYLQSYISHRMSLVIVGGLNTKHGRELIRKYRYNTEVRFLGSIYDNDKLNSLRRFSHAYLHGHSVGGTNPSLLEAMAAGSFVIAYDNVFNKTVLGDNTYYYGSNEDVTSLLNQLDKLIHNNKRSFIDNNIDTIREKYSWDHIADQHEQFFKRILSERE